VWACVLCVCATGRAQLVVSDSSVGYIDCAIPATLFRLRFDAAYSTTYPDRLEFQYAKYGTPGAPLVETAMNSFQEVTAYFEYALCDDFSMFAEVPARWLNPEVNANTGGLYDVNAGAKLAVHQTDQSLLTLQFRTIMATGDTDAGRSAGHASLEPAILFFHQYSERITIEAELRDWIPIDASQTGAGGGMGGGGQGGGGMGAGGQREFSANVLRYGVGIGYLLDENSFFIARPIAEVGGWYTFGGLKSDDAGQRIDAGDESTVNLKLGLRMGFTDGSLPFGESGSLFIGYGRALTDPSWYDDILRLEFRCQL
jgi:hypothetical protein